jgi:hypothetical protein
MSRIGSKNIAAFSDMILDQEAIEYMGTLDCINIPMRNSRFGDRHKQYSYNISLEERFAIVFAEIKSVTVSFCGAVN